MQFEIKEDKYSHANQVSIGSIMTVDYDTELQLPYVEIDWDATDSEVVKIVISDENKNNIRDLLAFKRNKRTGKVKYYISMNDTKSNDVWAWYDEEDLPELGECENDYYRPAHGALPARLIKRKFIFKE